MGDKKNVGGNLSHHIKMFYASYSKYMYSTTAFNNITSSILKLIKNVFLYIIWEINSFNMREWNHSNTKDSVSNELEHLPWYKWPPES